MICSPISISFRNNIWHFSYNCTGTRQTQSYTFCKNLYIALTMYFQIFLKFLFMIACLLTLICRRLFLSLVFVACFSMKGSDSFVRSVSNISSMMGSIPHIECTCHIFNYIIRPIVFNFSIDIHGNLAVFMSGQILHCLGIHRRMD